MQLGFDGAFVVVVVVVVVVTGGAVGIGAIVGSGAKVGKGVGIVMGVFFWEPVLLVLTGGTVGRTIVGNVLSGLVE